MRVQTFKIRSRDPDL